MREIMLGDVSLTQSMSEIHSLLQSCLKWNSKFHKLFCPQLGWNYRDTQALLSQAKSSLFPTCSFPFSAWPSQARSLWMYHECVTSDALCLFKQAPVTAKDAVWNPAYADSRVRKHSWKELILYKQTCYRLFLINW